MSISIYTYLSKCLYLHTHIREDPSPPEPEKRDLWMVGEGRRG
jgi:hypothetical protein